MKKINFLKLTILMALVLVCTMFHPGQALAKGPLDEILEYNMTVDVNEDATLDITYDISWMVLDSSSEGPLEWVEIGIPNKHCLNYEALTDTISRMKLKNSGSSAYVQVYLDKKYYAGDVANFSFKITMSNMYKIDDGDAYASYTFTPGWFDGITVDSMTIKWNNDKVEKWNPDCLVEDGYNVWSKKLNPGEKYTIVVQYPWDAYPFDPFEEVESGDYNSEDMSFGESIISVIVGLICIGVFMIFPLGFVVLPFVLFGIIYRKRKGFSSGTTKKITRTKIEYYPSCPGCGGNREPGKETCLYCGKSMIKSKEVIKEEDVPKEDKEILSYVTDGEYRYTSNPNVFVRVHVVNVPVSRPASSGSSHRSSCAHSSCACAHSSCACACACAGGGRAGCTTKDFYNTNLKLENLKYKKK